VGRGLDAREGERLRRAAALVVALLAGGCARPQPGGVSGAAAPVLRVGSSGDYPPFSVRAAGGTWSGFDVEVARAYARDRGRPLELVPFRWPELDAGLGRGIFEVAMSGITVRGDRLVDGDFTESVAATDAVLVARPGVTAPRRVVVNRGGHLERVARATLSGVELVPVDDNRRLLALVAEGAADGAVTDRLELASTGGDHLAVVAVLSSDQKAYWTTPANAVLARDLDAWLAEREADGTLRALRARHLGGGPASALEPAVTRVVDLLARRLMLMPLVAEAKRAAGLPIDDPARERMVEARAAETAARLCLEPRAYVALVRAEVAAAKAVQRAALAAPAPGPPPRTLETVRAAIDRVDAALGRALTAAVPITTSPSALETTLRRTAPRAADPVTLAGIAAALGALAQAPCLPPSQQVSMIERQRWQTSLPRSSITGPLHTGHASRHATTAPAVVCMPGS
jgi:cyclohexadienyl dehydratase